MENSLSSFIWAPAVRQTEQNCLESRLRLSYKVKMIDTCEPENICSKKNGYIFKGGNPVPFWKWVHI